jgi:hypothetical protein
VVGVGKLTRGASSVWEKLLFIDHDGEKMLMLMMTMMMRERRMDRTCEVFLGYSHEQGMKAFDDEDGVNGVSFFLVLFSSSSSSSSSILSERPWNIPHL